MSLLGSSARAINRVLRPMGVQLVRIPPNLKRLIDGETLVVQEGPFKGMLLNSKRTSWGNDALRMALGFYEEELSDSIEDGVKFQPSQVVNLGSADGFYAVGFARRLSSEVLAIDINPDSRKSLEVNVDINNLEKQRVRFFCSLDAAEPHLLARGLWFVDVEGAEEWLLNPRRLPVLRDSFIIVEVHEFLVPNLREVLQDRFVQTHSIEVVSSSGRNPNRSSFLRDASDNVKWSLISEERPGAMEWLIMRPSD